MNRNYALLNRDEGQGEKNWRLASILAGIIVLYITAVVAFIVVY